MSHSRKVGYLLLTLVIIFYTPYVALLLREGGELPPDFFYFPAKVATVKPDKNYLVIVITSLLFIAYLLLVFFPRIYGIRPATTPPPRPPKTRLPWWFWLGLILWGAIIVIFAAKLSGPKWLLNWALLPLWWGFIFMLDGMVYARNGGKSLMKNGMAELFAMGMLSISGWLIFEYFNFFININWFYPHAEIVTRDEFLLYAIIGSSAFIPMAFEWYHLLLTFPRINAGYRQGRKVKWSLTARIIILIVAAGLLFSMVFAPDSLFYAFWLGPLTILIIVLGLLGKWTPFRAIREQGDRNPLIVFSTVWVIQGLCVECWNRLSYFQAIAVRFHGGSFNPGYWDYCIPFVNFFHIFNMPLLGYLGYVPFGIYCFIWVITMSFVMNIKLPFTMGDNE
ncbi:hypothetical protein [[Flexibacter] sp. ATCC 35208]|uniref:hypothetical protein n=1 Tax=[Flexibacter] sp. ATCC 35208 TaxID=1936242 RepID=UPI00118168EA|nr:hypothetical protein [[Flexibacter] sp. ATCC 35208]